MADFLERVHKLSATVVFAFLCLHFANHFIGLLGPDAHLQFMEAVRLVYRHPIGEAVVLAAFVVQVLTGIPLVREIWVKRKDFAHQLFAASGVVMLAFIVLHIAMVLVTRLYLHLDTGLAFAAAGFQSPRLRWLFYGFYGAGVFSLFVHFGCVAYGVFKKSNKVVAWLLFLAVAGGGGYLTWLLLEMYAGKFYPIDVPAEYFQVLGG